MAHITTRDGTGLHVRSRGEGCPAVMLHGWPLSADSWDDQAMPIAEVGFEVITCDRPGLAARTSRSRGYDYDTLAEDLADVMEAAGATSNVTIVGLSMGGGKVACYRSHYGER